MYPSRNTLDFLKGIMIALVALFPMFHITTPASFSLEPKIIRSVCVLGKLSGKPIGEGAAMFKTGKKIRYVLRNQCLEVNVEKLTSNPILLRHSPYQLLSCTRDKNLIGIYNDSGKFFIEVIENNISKSYLLPNLFDSNLISLTRVTFSKDLVVFCQKRNLLILKNGIWKSFKLSKLNNWTSQSPEELLFVNGALYLRYDGGEFGGALTKFVVHREKEETIFSDSMYQVTDMLADNKGEVWFCCGSGTAGCLNRVEGSNFKVVISTGVDGFVGRNEQNKSILARIKWESNSVRFKRVFLDKYGNLLLLTAENDLFVLTDQKLQKVPVAPKLPRLITGFFWLGENDFLVAGNDIYKIKCT